MNYLEVRQVLEKDLEQLLAKRSQFIQDGREKNALEFTRLIKDTMSLINTLKIEGKEEFDCDEYDKSVDLWIKELMDSHLKGHKFDDQFQKLAYKTGFENALGLSKVIVKSMCD